MKNIVVFYDPAFPFTGDRPDEANLLKLRQVFTLADADGLSKALALADGYVHLHGTFFPKESWTSILRYLRSGKGMLAIGGAPFKIPVYREGANWLQETELTAYHQQLHIHEAIHVDCDPIEQLVSNPDIPLFLGKEELFTIESTFGLIMHVTRAEDVPKDSGSSGPIDAHLYPLLKGVSGDRELAAPAVLLEHTKGDFAGGRWIFINQPLRQIFWQPHGIEALKQWTLFIGKSVTEMWLKPTYAMYEPAERAALVLQTQCLAGKLNKAEESWSFQLNIWKSKKSEVNDPNPHFIYSDERYTAIWNTEFNLNIGRELRFERIRLPFPMESGFYIAECEAVSSSGERRTLRQGFWGMDASMLKAGEALACGRDYFKKNGRPFPVVGMTYMTSDVARKFLFLPNVAVWDRDMAQMKRAGINLIRTGVWTAWRQVMFIDGHAYEETLRAIDAFILTAKRHDLEVTFNFFAFTPEGWEGVNPYLDPRSVEAQKRFIASIVSRHVETTNVQWDLINEPSLFDPQRIFDGPRPLSDRYEREAYIGWLRERHTTVRLLQERWNMTPEELPSFEAAKPPERKDINFRPTEVLAMKGGQWLDYTLFTMDMHNRWAKQLVETIRSFQPKQLVTVGQDEGLVGLRPSPFFYAEAVDYTTVHTWWQMDDLVWDSVFGKAPDKPTLIQETGIMYVETPDGRAKRSEYELRNILERKYTYAFANGGAGAVQWIWNVNFYMNNVNESNIGALRADGTEKPEAAVSYDFGSFIGSIRDMFNERELENTVVIYPYSNDFSNRPLANKATAKAVRTLAYWMNTPIRGLGEYHLESLALYVPQLIIVPSAHNFSDEAMQRLINHITEFGGTLLLTGPVGLDAYWHRANRLKENLGAGEIVNLLREEALEIDGKLWPVSFGESRIADSCKQIIANTSSGISHLVELAAGQGRLLWCPLPVELNEDPTTVAALYRHAMNLAGIPVELEWLSGESLRGVYGRKLVLSGGSLFVFVSEYGSDAELSVKDTRTGMVYSFTLQSERTIMFAADLIGQLIAVYRPQEVQISVELA